MSTSDEAVLSFLTDNDVTQPQRLKVALVMAESMVRELEQVLGEWKETVERLRSVKTGSAAAVN